LYSFRSAIRPTLIGTSIFLTKAKAPRQSEICLLMETLSQEGSPMFTVEQYRAKASEYAALAATASGANERREFQRLERSFTDLADNAQWMIENRDKTVARAQGTL
jgi:hypothetical protein